jgi:hypothetical protein
LAYVSHSSSRFARVAACGERKTRRCNVHAG